MAQLLNIAFDMAAWEILGALSHGATLVIRGDDIAATARDVDVVIATPRVLALARPCSVPQRKVVAVAGEPCPQPLADAWSALRAFHNACGPTETTIVNTMQRYDPGAALLTIGRPDRPTTRCTSSTSTAGRARSARSARCGRAATASRAGYLGNDALTAERYAPDPSSAAAA